MQKVNSNKKTDQYYFLVIGSNSFTGSHFIAYLLSRGVQCVGISRSKEQDSPFLAYKWSPKNMKFFKFHQFDLNKDLDKVVELINSKRFSHIVNFAAQSMVGQSWRYPEDWYQTNVVSLSKLVNQLKDFRFIKKYVSATTPEVYGTTDGWVKENFNFAPSTPYAISRAAQDLHLKAYFENFDFPVVFTRAANVYGPGQSLYRIIPRTFIEALTGGALILDGGGKSVRSFIHVSDVSSATLKISLDGEIGSSYHISGTKSIQIKNLVELISNLCDVPIKKFVEIGPDRPGKDYVYLLDSTRMREELNWSDEVSLADGLTETLDWTRDNFNFLKNCSREYIHRK